MLILPCDYAFSLGLSVSESPMDSMEVDLVQKTDKIIVAGELSAEAVEMVKQTSQVEAAGNAFVSQVDSVEKAGKIDIELIGHVNEIGEGAQAASVPEESSKQVGNVEQAYISGDNTCFEAVTETPSTAQVHTENDTGNEVLEEHMVSPELQSQTSDEKLVGQSASEQKVGPEDPKSQAEISAPKPVVQGAVGQVEVEVESKTMVEVSGELGYSIEHTVQVEAVTEASGGQVEVGKQISEDESMANAAIEHSMVMVEETVEAKVVPVEENVENNAAAVGVVGETAEGETKEEAPHEKGEIENKEDTDKLAGETREGEITVEVPDEKTENEAHADTLAGETREGEITVEAPSEKIANKAIDELISGKTTEGQTIAGASVEARTAEETVEDVKVLDDKLSATEKPVEDATVVTHENSTTVEKTVEDAMVVPADTNTTNAEKSAVGTEIKTDEDAPAAVEKTTEDISVDAPDVQAGASE